MDIYKHVEKILQNKKKITIVEVGCNVGIDTLKLYEIAKKYCDSLKIIAIEPEINVFKEARDVYCIGKEEIVILNKAISNKNGKTKFFVSGNGYTGSSSIKKPNLEKIHLWWPEMVFEESEVEVTTLDSLKEQFSLDFIDFVWADIQGAERELIEGGENFFKSCGYFYTEYNGEDDGRDGLYIDDAGPRKILSLLPDWNILEDYGGNFLLKNNNYL